MTWLRRAAVAEAVTLLVLFFVAMPMKHLFGMPVAVSIAGPIHGFTFMVFLWLVIRSWGEELISVRGAARLIAGAFIPAGGFINERWLREQPGEPEIR